MEFLFLQLQNLPSLKLPMSLSLSALFQSFKEDVEAHTSASKFQTSLLIIIGIKCMKFRKITEMFGDLALKVADNLQIVF